MPQTAWGEGGVPHRHALLCLLLLPAVVRGIPFTGTLTVVVRNAVGIASEPIRNAPLFAVRIMQRGSFADSHEKICVWGISCCRRSFRLAGALPRLLAQRPKSDWGAKVSVAIEDKGQAS
jgi:hypothetical protein